MPVRPGCRFRLLLAVLCVVALTSCARTDDSRPSRRAPLPELTSSSEKVRTTKSIACTLLTADERSGFAGRPMDVLVPVYVMAGTQECQWAHTVKGSADSIVRVQAFKTRDWAQVARYQIVQAMRSPRFDTATVRRLQAAERKLAKGPSALSSAEICDIYWVLVGAWGVPRGSESVFRATIGSMPAAYAVGCSDGVFTMLGYGEIGLQASPALFEAIIDLRKKVHERAVRLLGAEGSDEPSDGTSGSDSDAETASTTEPPTPSPSTTESGSAEPTDSTPDETN